MKLANAHKQNNLANKISQYITEKEQRAVLESSRVVQSQNNTFNSAQMEMAIKQKPMDEPPRKNVDLSQYAVVNNGQE